MNNNLGCVYTIQCVVNGAIYVGQTIDFYHRRAEHINKLLSNKHENLCLQKDFNDYGLSNFKFTIVKDGLTKEQRLQAETYYIRLYGGIESNCVYNYQDNITQNLEMRKKISERQIGRKMKPESIEKMKQSLSNKMKGKKPWNTGKRKYSDSFIKQLRYEYSVLNKYSLVSKLHPQMSYDVIKSLIQFGTTNKKCNDYPNKGSTP